MAIAFADISRLRSALMLFVCLSAAGVALAVLSSRLAGREARANAAALAERSAAASRLARADRETANLRRTLAVFEKFAEQGGDSRLHRAKWSDAIAQIRKRRGIPALRFEIAPARALEGSSVSGDGVPGSEFLVTPMKLQMQLLHEEDLLGFVADLDGAGPGFPHVRGCDLKRGEALLDAECTVDWITLHAQT